MSQSLGMEFLEDNYIAGERERGKQEVKPKHVETRITYIRLPGE